MNFYVDSLLLKSALAGHREDSDVRPHAFATREELLAIFAAKRSRIRH